MTRYICKCGQRFDNLFDYWQHQEKTHGLKYKENAVILTETRESGKNNMPPMSVGIK